MGWFSHFLFNVYIEQKLFAFYNYLFKLKSGKWKVFLLLLFFNAAFLALGIYQYNYMDSHSSEKLKAEWESQIHIKLGDDWSENKIGYKKCFIDSGIITSFFAPFYSVLVTCNKFVTAWP
jgi:hypothetical protein